MVAVWRGHAKVARSAVAEFMRRLPRSEPIFYRNDLDAWSVIVLWKVTHLAGQEEAVQSASWISTESVDRVGEVVAARGMNDSQFQANPLVMLGHAHWMPPVGTSLCGGVVGRPPQNSCSWGEQDEEGKLNSRWAGGGRWQDTS